MKSISFILNGKAVHCDVEDNELLLQTLRERLSITSVKEGCSIGECGVCTVLIDNEPQYSCLTLSTKVEGRDVKTVEFLGDELLLHPLQVSFMTKGAVQCGFCTPAMLLVGYSLLLKNKRPGAQEVREALSGVLCRCTGYAHIIEAIQDAAPFLESATAE